MAFRLPTQNTYKFDDLFVIDETRGFAIIDDISTIARNDILANANQGASLLDADGNFIYELKFFVNTTLLASLGINQVLVDVHRESPAVPKGAFISAPQAPREHALNILGRKSGANPYLTKNPDNSDDKPSIIASDIVQLPFREPTKVTNPNQLAETPVQDPSITETMRLRNNLGGSSQRFVVQVMTPKSQQDFALTSLDKLSLSGVSRAAYVNNDVKNVMSNNSSAGNNAAAMIAAEDYATVSTELIGLGVHPAEAVESLFPKNSLVGASEFFRGESGTRSELGVAREPVRQPAASSFEDDVFERQFSRRKASSSFRTQSQETKNNFQSVGLLGKSYSNLAKNLVKISDEGRSFDRDSSIASVNEGDFYSDYLLIKKKIAVSLRRAGTRPKLYFNVKLVSPENPQTNLQKIFIAEHERQILEFTVPDKKPLLMLKRQMPGKNTITVKQEDEFATAIIVERRFLHPRENYPLPYETIKRVDIKFSDIPAEIDDIVVNEGLGKYVYRAVSLGPLGQRGICVSHIVVPNINLPAHSRGLENSGRLNAFTSMCLPDGILLKLSNYPPDTLGFFINKFPLNSPAAINMRPDIVEVNESGTTVQLIQGNAGEPMTVLDRNVTDNLSYTYICQLKMPYGNIVDTAPTHIKFLRMARSVPVNFEIKQVAVNEISSSTAEQEDTNIKISFEIDVTTTDAGIEEIIQTLSSSGVDGAFINELRQDRSRISNLAFTEITRVNLKTGFSENFGINREKYFVDSPDTRRARGISPVTRGDRFEYIVKLYLMSPESLFKSALTPTGINSSTDLRKTQSDAEFLAQKFARTYLGINDLPSESDLIENSSNNAILRGFTGITKTTEIQTTPSQVSLSEVRSVMSPLGHNEITWRVLSGDPAIIDYYIVSSTYHGNTQPVGVVASNSSSQMIFYDRRFAGFVGDVLYSVTAVLLNGRTIQSTSPSPVTRRQTMSKSLIDSLTATKSNTYFDRATQGGTDPRILNPRGGL